MKAHGAVPFVDTNIIPDRNAGIGSLLWDLQNTQASDRVGPPLLGPDFAFIDVGASRAKAATALKSLLATDLGMSVDYVATELPGVVPSAHVTVLGDSAEAIRRYLTGMISSAAITREVTEWHFVVGRDGTASSVAYAYHQHGNEVWEPYFLGRPFMLSGETVEFHDPTLDALLAPHVARIEAGLVSARTRDSDPSRPRPSWDGYAIARDPLVTGLADFGITLQSTDVPQRIDGRQNVLFLGNVLNHHAHERRAPELDRIAANMQAGDLVIVQVDETETSSIDVLLVTTHVGQKARERVRWIDTKTLDVLNPVRDSGSLRQISMRPELERIAGRLMDCLARRARSPEWSEGRHQALVRRHVSQVFGTYFRALPVEATLRVAIREVVRRLPLEVGPKGLPVFRDDAKDAYGGALGLDPEPIVSEADLADFGPGNPEPGVDRRTGNQLVPR